jgi:pyridoxal phosphate enzyme (YggS family)
MESIKNNLIQLRHDIQTCEHQFARPPHSVFLLAVSKKQSTEKIQTALDAGQQAFGENYLQEALPKIIFFKNTSIVWHFIGPIQRNKAKKISEHFAWVQSVSDSLIAKKLNDYRPSDLPPLNICLQVNISDEKTKSGVAPDELYALADDCILLPRLTLRGLMAIPAPKNSFEEQAKDFHRLRILFEDLRKKYPSIDTLSMGMSDDLAAAIAEGSTMIRIGTKIFGKRTT